MSALPEGWVETTLGDVVERVTKGTTPKTFSANKDDINYIKSDALDYNGRLNVAKFLKVTHQVHEQLKRSQLKENDILLSMAGAFLGKTGLVSKEMLPANTNQAAAIISANIGVINHIYLWYKLRDNKTVRYFNSIPSQSAQPNINFTEIKSLPINLPSLPEQKAIADMLSSFDEKIELLREQNKTLESLAQTIFKEWFVNFNCPDATGEMVDSELGKIPKGWRVDCVYNMAEYINGAAYKNMHFSEGLKGLPVIKIVELKSGISDQTKFTETNLGEKYKIDNDDILFSWSGSPETSIDIFIWTLGRAYLNQHIFKVIPHSGIGKYYVYNMLKYLKPIFISIAKMKQTTGLGHVTIGDLKKILFVIPDEPVLKSYSDVIKHTYEKQFQLNIQIQTLSKTRDTLLPKLMSGQVRLETLEIEPSKEELHYDS